MLTSPHQSTVMFSSLWSCGAALGIGLVAGFTPLSAQAIDTNSLTFPSPESSNLTVEVAPAPMLVAELYDLCLEEESTYLVAETENYWLSICGGHAPYTYVGIDKVTEDAIELDLSDYAEDGSWFEAINGDYTYLIIFGTARGNFLTVMEGDTTILQEYLVDWE